VPRRWRRGRGSGRGRRRRIIEAQQVGLGLPGRRVRRLRLRRAAAERHLDSSARSAYLGPCGLPCALSALQAVQAAGVHRTGLHPNTQRCSASPAAPAALGFYHTAHTAAHKIAPPFSWGGDRGALVTVQYAVCIEGAATALTRRRASARTRIQARSPTKPRLTEWPRARPAAAPACRHSCGPRLVEREHHAGIGGRGGRRQRLARGPPARAGQLAAAPQRRAPLRARAPRPRHRRFAAARISALDAQPVRS